MDKEFEKIIEELKEKASSISMDEEKISSLFSDVKEKLEDNIFLASIASDIKLTIEMITAWQKGEYTDLSQNTIVLVIAALLYIVNPLNILPKILEKTIIDDILIGVYVLKKIKEELRNYKEWKENTGYRQKDESEEKRNYIDL